MYLVLLPLCGNEGRGEVDFCVLLCVIGLCVSHFSFVLSVCCWMVVLLCGRFYSVYALMVGRFVRSTIECTLLETLPSSRSLGIKSK